MSTYYKRTCSIDGAKDALFAAKVLERADLALAAQTYEAFASANTTLAAAMGAPMSLDMGDVATAAVVYVEYLGANLTLTITDSYGAKVLALSAVTENVLVLEGVQVTALAVQNADSTEAAPFFYAVFGAGPPPQIV